MSGKKQEHLELEARRRRLEGGGRNVQVPALHKSPGLELERKDNITSQSSRVENGALYACIKYQLEIWDL